MVTNAKPIIQSNSAMQAAHLLWCCHKVWCFIVAMVTHVVTPPGLAELPRVGGLDNKDSNVQARS